MIACIEELLAIARFFFTAVMADQWQVNALVWVILEDPWITYHRADSEGLSTVLTVNVFLDNGNHPLQQFRTQNILQGTRIISFECYLPVNELISD